MSRKITSKDIARRANVSQATVSYVLNNAPGKSISEHTRKRVLDAVAELNYIPNSAAKRLKSNRSYCIAVRLGTTLNMPRYYNAMQGIRSYLEPRGYNILLCNDQERGNTYNFIDTYLNTQTDGVIYVSSNHSDIPPDALEQINTHNIPFSTIDCMSENPTISSVRYDYFASSYQRADYLLNKGFKKFIYIRPSYENAKETARERGFKAVVLGQDNLSYEIISIGGIDANSSMFSQNNFSFEPDISDIQMIKNIVNSAPLDTCFICSSREVQKILSDRLYIQHLTLQSPETQNWFDRSVSYHFSHYSAGTEAARSLLNIINNKDEVRKITLQPILEPVDPSIY
ncbi:MAG TPA: LacI family transcriptional regulator [Clostridiales bacterium]|nr:LacI family transcriptional regulator [Clostridiales bacterium]